MNLIKAIFFSSISVIPAYIFIVILSEGITELSVITEPFLWFWVLIAYSIGLFVILVVGVPTHLILRAMKIESFFPYFLIAFLTPCIFTWWSEPFGEDGFYWVAWQGVLLGIFGVMCAYIFYSFANGKNT